MNEEMTGTGLGSLYRSKKLARASEAGKIYKITSPIGNEFWVTDIDLSLFAVAGALPQAVGEKMQRAQNQGLDNEAAFKTLSAKEQDASFQFSNKLLKAFCVNPKIVKDPQSDDELAIEELEPEDLEFLITAATGGNSLDSFRNERQQPAASGSNGKKQRDKGK